MLRWTLRKAKTAESFFSFGKKILWSSGGSRIALRWVTKSQRLNFAKACGCFFVVSLHQVSDLSALMS